MAVQDIKPKLHRGKIVEAHGQQWLAFHREGPYYLAIAAGSRLPAIVQLIEVSESSGTPEPPPDQDG